MLQFFNVYLFEIYHDVTNIVFKYHLLFIVIDQKHEYRAAKG